MTATVRCWSSTQRCCGGLRRRPSSWAPDRRCRWSLGVGDLGDRRGRWAGLVSDWRAASRASGLGTATRGRAGVGPRRRRGRGRAGAGRRGASAGSRDETSARASASWGPTRSGEPAGTVPAPRRGWRERRRGRRRPRATRRSSRPPSRAGRCRCRTGPSRRPARCRGSSPTTTASDEDLELVVAAVGEHAAVPHRRGRLGRRRLRRRASSRTTTRPRSARSPTTTTRRTTRSSRRRRRRRTPRTAASRRAAGRGAGAATEPPHGASRCRRCGDLEGAAPRGHDREPDAAPARRRRCRPSEPRHHRRRGRCRRARRVRRRAPGDAVLATVDRRASPRSSSTRRSAAPGYHPATVLGLLGCVAIVPIAYDQGETRVPARSPCSSSSSPCSGTCSRSSTPGRRSTSRSR